MIKRIRRQSFIPKQKKDPPPKVSAEEALRDVNLHLKRIFNLFIVYKIWIHD